MKYTIQMLCVSIMLFYFANADALSSVKHSSLMQYQSIYRDMDESITTNKYPSPTLMFCSAQCARDMSLSLYYDETDKTCQCNNGTDASEENDSSKKRIVYAVYATIVELSTTNNFTKLSTIPRQSDCLDLYNLGFADDGVYTIQPSGQTPVDTWCDMQNGGWTVIQRRLDGSEDFYRGWSDYVSGFGNRTGEYWLGLDNIHALTSQPSEMHTYGEAFEGTIPQSATAHYSSFKVDGPADKYRVTAGGFSGPCDSIFYYYGNHMQFTTYDSDNDRAVGINCAVQFRGAWWYDSCHGANLNGYYYGGVHISEADGVNWITCWGPYYSVKTIIMKVRRTPSP